MHGGSVFLRSEGIQSVFTPVEVLKYFCSVQKGKQTRPPPEGRKDAVIVNSDLPRFAILIQGLTLSFGFVCCIFLVSVFKMYHKFISRTLHSNPKFFSLVYLEIR